MRTIFYITTQTAWAAAKTQGHLTAESLVSEGFIHCSYPRQVLGVGERYFKGKKDLLLLQLQEERVNVPIKAEGTADKFPHIYGPLNLDAVVAVYDFVEGPNGFALPQELQLVGDILVRLGLPGDEAEIASAHTHAWQESYKGLISEDFLRARPLSFRSRMNGWRSTVEAGGSPFVFVAESSQHGIVAFCSGAAGRDEDFADQGEITAIYALDSYKGKGIGAALLQRGLAALRAQGFRQQFLWVLRDNPKTIAFYKKMGGTVLEKTKLEPVGQEQLAHVAVAFNEI